ncbi:MAG: hypothetical protein WD670_05175, partial [Actinomycetota bacterium]
STEEEIVDLSVDADWRPRRLRIGSGEHHLILQFAGGSFVGARDDEQLQLAQLVDVGYRSPGFAATTANRLLHEGIVSADLEITQVAASTLELGTSRQRFERLGDEVVTTPVGRFDATRWRHTDLDSEVAGEFWTGGAIILAYPGVLELREYDPVGAGPFPH